MDSMKARRELVCDSQAAKLLAIHQQDFTEGLSEGLLLCNRLKCSCNSG